MGKKTGFEDERWNTVWASRASSTSEKENQVVLTEMEFVWGLQLDEEAHSPDAEDVAPAISEREQKSKVGGWAEVKNVTHDVKMAEKEVKPEEMYHETSLGKGLSGVLQLLAHHLSTIRKADLVVVLQPSVLEVGTHDVLFTKGENGTYAKLINMQDLVQAIAMNKARRTSARGLL